MCISQFIRERVTTCKDKYVQSSHAYTLYHNWCRANNIVAECSHSASFSRTASKLGLAIDRRRGASYFVDIDIHDGDLSEEITNAFTISTMRNDPDERLRLWLPKPLPIPLAAIVPIAAVTTGKLVAKSAPTIPSRIKKAPLIEPINRHQPAFTLGAPLSVMPQQPPITPPLPVTPPPIVPPIPIPEITRTTPRLRVVPAPNYPRAMCETKNKKSTAPPNYPKADGIVLEPGMEDYSAYYSVDISQLPTAAYTFTFDDMPRMPEYHAEWNKLFAYYMCKAQQLWTAFKHYRYLALNLNEGRKHGETAEERTQRASENTRREREFREAITAHERWFDEFDEPYPLYTEGTDWDVYCTQLNEWLRTFRLKAEAKNKWFPDEMRNLGDVGCLLKGSKNREMNLKAKLKCVTELHAKLRDPATWGSLLMSPVKANIRLVVSQ